MLTIRNLKIPGLILLMAVFVGLAQTPAPAGAASYSQEDSNKVKNLCADKLNIKVGSKRGNDQLILGACVTGYFLGLEGKDAKACEGPYKRVDRALKACKQTGFNLGKANPLNIKSKQQQQGGQGQGGQGDHCTAHNNCDLVRLYVNPLIRILGIAVGLIVAASLIMGGIQYSASSGDPQRTSAAKSRITNTLLAFLAFAFLYAFLNFLVPGGIFQ